MNVLYRHFRLCVLRRTKRLDRLTGPGLALPQRPGVVRTFQVLFVPRFALFAVGVWALVVLVLACAGWALDSRWPVPSRLLACKPFHRKKLQESQLQELLSALRWLHPGETPAGCTRAAYRHRRAPESSSGSAAPWNGIPYRYSSVVPFAGQRLHRSAATVQFSTAKRVDSCSYQYCHLRKADTLTKNTGMAAPRRNL